METIKQKSADSKPQKLVLKGLRNPKEAIAKLLKDHPLTEPLQTKDVRIESSKLKEQQEKFLPYLTVECKEQASTFIKAMLDKLENDEELTPNMEKALQKSMEAKNKEPEKVTLKVKQWFCNRKKFSSRFVTGTIERETEKAYYFIGHADMYDTKTCWRCGKELTNPASYFAGVGEVCAKKAGVPYPKKIEEMTSEEKRAYSKSIKQVLEHETYEGWVPKSQVETVE